MPRPPYQHPWSGPPPSSGSGAPRPRRQHRWRGRHPPNSWPGAPSPTAHLPIARSGPHVSARRSLSCATPPRLQRPAPGPNRHFLPVAPSPCSSAPRLTCRRGWKPIPLPNDHRGSPRQAFRSPAFAIRPRRAAGCLLKPALDSRDRREPHVPNFRPCSSSTLPRPKVSLRRKSPPAIDRPGWRSPKPAWSWTTHSLSRLASHARCAETSSHNVLLRAPLPIGRPCTLAPTFRSPWSASLPILHVHESFLSRPRGCSPIRPWLPHATTSRAWLPATPRSPYRRFRRWSGAPPVSAAWPPCHRPPWCHSAGFSQKLTLPSAARPSTLPSTRCSQSDGCP
mmetsp:Transcript_93391/g.263623  ORF Transcript_93391/g.263623 Transcript_93391/m.263623 type:complete len:338 (-) Transcript_93391:465-1478(-)